MHRPGFAALVMEDVAEGILHEQTLLLLEGFRQSSSMVSFDFFHGQNSWCAVYITVMFLLFGFYMNTLVVWAPSYHTFTVDFVALFPSLNDFKF